MTLKERLIADLKDAMRSGDTIRKNVIRLVRAAIKNAEIAAQKEISDEQVAALIAKDIKRSQESIEYFEKGDRQDLISAELAKIDILAKYLPEQLPDETIVQTVEQVIAALGASGPASLGPVMRESMAKLKGNVDGRRVNQIARELLGKQ